MREFGFAIGPENQAWRWRVIGPEGEVASEGLCASKAHAAALVIRGLVRAETGDANARPRRATLQAKAA